MTLAITAIAALLLGFLAALLTTRPRTWCATCGVGLSCGDCHRRAQELTHG